MSAQELQRSIDRNVQNALRVCDYDLSRIVLDGKLRCVTCGSVLTVGWQGDVCGFCANPSEPVAELSSKGPAARARRWAEADPDFLRAERDRLRPIPVPAKSEEAPSPPRTVTRWVRVGRHFALRQFPVAQPVKTDAWGRPIR